MALTGRSERGATNFEAVGLSAGAIRARVSGRRRSRREGEWTQGGAVELDWVTTPVTKGSGEEARRKTKTGGMLDFEQQTNQALASLDDDWHLLEGECTTFAIFPLFSSFLAASRVRRRAKTGRPMPHAAQNSNPPRKEEREEKVSILTRSFIFERRRTTYTSS